VSHEVQETIWASHRDICRFSSEEDLGYKRLVRWITEFAAHALSRRAAERDLASNAQPPLVDITTEPESMDITG
jgi:hypothetical protein